MSLDAGKGSNGNGYSGTMVYDLLTAIEQPPPVRSSPFEKWLHWEPSVISHHSKACCDIALEWLIATDRSELGQNSVMTGPRWIRRTFKWGASAFPIYWCEAIRKDTLDCGALAAMTDVVLRARGLESARVQMVEEFSENATKQWGNAWSNEPGTLPWTEGNMIYHEGCAVVMDNQDIKVWDPSTGWWVDPKVEEGYGAIIALRVSHSNIQEYFNWGTMQIDPNEWTLMS